MTTASFYAGVTREQLKEVFKGHNDSEIPLFGERLDILHQAGRKLLEVSQMSIDRSTHRDSPALLPTRIHTQNQSLREL